MNPNSGEGAPQHQFELPVQPEDQPQTGEIQSDNALERANPSESGAGNQQPPPAPPILPAAPLTDDQVQAAADDAAAPHQISDDQAREGDIIEKVWINKAKAIIAQTQDDPFIQKNEMSRVKADYIQKRFNKTIPVDDKKA
jgi:hypothetical protein